MRGPETLFPRSAIRGPENRYHHRGEIGVHVRAVVCGWVYMIGQSVRPKEGECFPAFPVQKREMVGLVNGNHGEIFEYKSRSHARVTFSALAKMTW